MGEQVDKLKAKYKADRISDPHGWAYEIEKRADQRSLFGALAFLISLFLAVNVWMLWKERDRMLAKIEGRQEQTDCVTTPGPSGELPPPGFC